MNFFSKIKESAMELLSKIKKNRFFIFLFMLLAVVFVIVVFSENPEWIFKLLEVTEKEKPKREALKFLGISMMGVILGVLMLSKKFSRFRTFQNFLITLIVLLGIVFVVVMFSENPEWIFKLLGIDKNEEAKKYEALKFLGIGMGGILVALQALMSYKRAKAMEETAKAQADAANAQADGAKAQARATEEQAKANLYTEQGQRQERLKNAIEHLGHGNDTVRLGGAYELFHLAEDTEELRQTVLDILCAHIRRTTSESEYQKAHKSKPSEEVQSLLTLLFVLPHGVFKGIFINLRGSYLNGADLCAAKLHGTDLIRAQLHGAYLMAAQLHGAHLAEARLHGAYLAGARLQGARLSRARLHGADLIGAQLHGAHLADTQLHGAYLAEAHLHGAYLTGTKLHGVRCQGDFSDTFVQHMMQAISKESDLSRAIFAGGLSLEDMESIVEGMSDENADELREKLRSHIDKPISNELPEDSGAITGTYTEEEAEKWIAEYQEAMSEVLEDDN